MNAVASSGVALTLAPMAFRAGRAHAQAAPLMADLGGGLRVLTHGGRNVLSVASDEGYVLVDGVAAADSSALVAQLASLPGGNQIHTLFNSHWHPEHTGANAALAQSGAAIVAHENTRLWTTTDVTWPWNEQTVEPLPKPAQATQTFRDALELTVGGRPVVARHLRDCPHTDGDIYVFFPDDNVLAIGDAVYGPGAGWPAVDWWTGGWIGGIVGALDMLFAVADADTRIVPAHGGVMTRSDLRAQHEMYGPVWESLLRTLYSGGGPKEALADNPAAAYENTMGDSEEFVTRAFESLWAYLSPDA